MLKSKRCGLGGEGGKRTKRLNTTEKADRKRREREREREREGERERLQ